jgi:hypothetical protein
MKTNIKLLVGLPVLICLAIALFLEIAQEYKKAGVVSATGYEATQLGRVPAFSIITIKGRAFAAQKPEVTEAETEEAATPEVSGKRRSNLLPLAYQMINKTFVSGK